MRMQTMRLSEAIGRYVARCKAQGMASSTIYTVEHQLERFHVGVAKRQPKGPNPYLHLIDSALCDDYCYGPEGIKHGMSAASSFNRVHSCIKVFFDYAFSMGWVDKNPMGSVPKAARDAPKQRLILNASELTALLEVANPIERIGCAIGMNTGLRANDIRRLTVFDVSLASGELMTEIRKTKQLDIKPITSDLHDELVRWLDLYAKMSGLSGRDKLPDNWILVPPWRVMPWLPEETRYQIKPLSIHSNPFRLVKRPLARLGYPVLGEGFHTLRRSSARALFESLRVEGTARDHALMICRDFLNHSSVSMTEHYLGLSYERTIRDDLLKSKPFLSALRDREQAKLAENNGTTQALRRVI